MTASSIPSSSAPSTTTTTTRPPPSLSASLSFSSITSITSNTSSLDGGNGANSNDKEDRRLHNMPKQLATLCVQAFIDWGHDHKGHPLGYQAFLDDHLPHYPGVDSEKVRLFFKNIAATYVERYLPACARGYSSDFLVWWENRPGRGRPKKEKMVANAYSLTSEDGGCGGGGGTTLHASYSSDGLTSVGDDSSSSSGGGGGRGPILATTKRRARKPVNRYVAAIPRRNSKPPSSRGSAKKKGAGKQQLSLLVSSSSSLQQEEIKGMMQAHNNQGEYYDDEDEYVVDEDLYVIQRPPVDHGVMVGGAENDDAYEDNAMMEEKAKRARIEAALAMMEMDNKKKHPPAHLRTPAFRHKPKPIKLPRTPVAVCKPMSRQIPLGPLSPVPLDDHEVSVLLTDLRSRSKEQGTTTNEEEMMMMMFNDNNQDDHKKQQQQHHQAHVQRPPGPPCVVPAPSPQALAGLASLRLARPSSSPATTTPASSSASSFVSAYPSFHSTPSISSPSSFIPLPGGGRGPPHHHHHHHHYHGMPPAVHPHAPTTSAPVFNLDLARRMQAYNAVFMARR